jgi:DNA-binding CsgD family transcriptional regulator
MDQDLVDRIYESSVVPELWPSVLDELARTADAIGGIFFVANTKVVSWTCSAIMQYGMEKFAKSDIFARGQRGNRLIAARHAGFLTEHDIYPNPDERGADPYYSESLFRAGAGWGTATAIPLPNGDVIFLTLERRLDRGPVEASVVHQLDELRPHLARSALMSARLQLERARVASETLAALGLPALVLNEHGKVLAANSLIEALTGYVQWRAQDRVSLKDRAADKLLRDGIAAIDVAGAAVRSFPVRDTGAEAMMVAHVIPIRLSARDIFVRCAAALVLTPVTMPQAPPVELVQSLFDLTPAEARVARSLAAGETVDAIASARGVSQNTVRDQVRGILEKTGCHRQVDIVALLTAISPARLTHPA